MLSPLLHFDCQPFQCSAVLGWRQLIMHYGGCAGLIVAEVERMHGKVCDTERDVHIQAALERMADMERRLHFAVGRLRWLQVIPSKTRSLWPRMGQWGQILANDHRSNGCGCVHRWESMQVAWMPRPCPNTKGGVTWNPMLCCTQDLWIQSKQRQKRELDKAKELSTAACERSESSSNPPRPPLQSHAPAYVAREVEQLTKERDFLMVRLKDEECAREDAVCKARQLGSEELHRLTRELVSVQADIESKHAECVQTAKRCEALEREQASEKGGLATAHQEIRELSEQIGEERSKARRAAESAARRAADEASEQLQQLQREHQALKRENAKTVVTLRQVRKGGNGYSYIHTQYPIPNYE